MYENQQFFGTTQKKVFQDANVLYASFSSFQTWRLFDTYTTALFSGALVVKRGHISQKY